MVEQGCVPILRMVAGDLEESVFERAAAQLPRRSRGGVAVDKNKEPVPSKNTSKGKPTVASASEGCLIEALVQTPEIKPALEVSRRTISEQQNNTENVSVGRRYSTDDAVEAPQSPPNRSTRRDAPEALRQMPGVVVETRGAGDKTAARTRTKARSVAQSLLSAITKEACTSELARFVRVVNSSGNRELRTNVVVAIVLLSLEKEGDGDIIGREVKTYKP